MFLLPALNIFHTLSWCLHCWVWTNKCQLVQSLKRNFPRINYWYFSVYCKVTQLHNSIILQRQQNNTLKFETLSLRLCRQYPPKDGYHTWSKKLKVIVNIQKNIIKIWRTNSLCHLCHSVYSSFEFFRFHFVTCSFSTVILSDIIREKHPWYCNYYECWNQICRISLAFASI